MEIERVTKRLYSISVDVMEHCMDVDYYLEEAFIEFVGTMESRCSGAIVERFLCPVGRERREKRKQFLFKGMRLFCAIKYYLTHTFSSFLMGIFFKKKGGKKG